MRSKSMKMAKRPAPKKGTLGRLLKLLFKQNKALLITVFICLTISAVVSVASSVFLKNLIDVIRVGLKDGMDSVWLSLVTIFVTMGGVYGIGVLGSFTYTRLMAILTQKFLHQIRTGLFNKMQSYPIRFFDTHKTGNIMSTFTNDTDALRQLVSQSIPQLFTTMISTTTLLVIMFTSSLWLTLVIFVGVVAMFIVTKIVGGNSAKYFIKQQQSIGKTEGYIQEMMQGQKVIKVFCHENESKEGFDKNNEQLYQDAKNAHTFANILMPIMGNLGNILYVLVAFIGGILVLNSVPNVTVLGLQEVNPAAFLSIIIAFLTD